ncbi:hypothetical protein HF521_003739 [Silurus meridionalis]|uniref:Uncharacterized protein n=1 Tax=Silurus meridionalis TaxID=175797 RepID=A0A8T0AZ75_SILME|nr:hypothetical protein HF521_003739 [Silurus meridionalis]
MDVHGIEEALEEELEKLNNDIPASVFTYFQVSSSRLNAFEQLILEDVEDLESMCNEMFSTRQHADLSNELGSDFDEDPLQLKERIMSELEEEVSLSCESHDSTGDYDIEYDTHKDTERQLMLEWRQLDENLRKEEEQRLAELEAEKEQCLKSAREEEEEEFEYLQPEGDGEINQSFQLEIVKQQELIQKLEEQIAEERRVLRKYSRKRRGDLRHGALQPQQSYRQLSEGHRCVAGANKHLSGREKKKGNRGRKGRNE